jgi:hypothetical protein
MKKLILSLLFSLFLGYSFSQPETYSKKILNADGTVSLNQDGFLNDVNYTVSLSNDNAPIFQELNATDLSSSGQGTWSYVGSPNANGVSGGNFANICVHALAVYKGELYVGGFFNQAGSLPVSNIAKWDGTNWSDVGGGVSGPVDAFTIFNNELVVGGSFNKAGNVNASKIASWDGSTWKAFGPGFNQSAQVSALCVYNSELIAGGNFSQSGSSSVKRIAKWDGTQWQQLGNGFSGYVHSLFVYNGELLIGGGGDQGLCPHFVVWDGSVMKKFSNDCPDHKVNSMALYNNQLYIAGEFSQIGNNTTNGVKKIAKWNNSANKWETLGTGYSNGTEGIIWRLIVFNNKLYAGGQIVKANDKPIRGIASWDGANFDSLGSGVWGNILALAEYKGELYVAGCITQAGGIMVNKIAKWKPSVTSINEITASKSHFYVFPNPAHDFFTLQTQQGGVFELVDIAGRVLNTYTINNTNETIQTNLPSGMYFIREKESGVTQKLLIE